MWVPPSHHQPESPTRLQRDPEREAGLLWKLPLPCAVERWRAFKPPFISGARGGLKHGTAIHRPLQRRLTPRKRPASICNPRFQILKPKQQTVRITRHRPSGKKDREPRSQHSLSGAEMALGSESGMGNLACGAVWGSEVWGPSLVKGLTQVWGQPGWYCPLTPS